MEKINDGNVWEGNEELFYHEQKNILQSMYDKNEYIWDFLDNLDVLDKTSLLNSPIPGDTGKFTNEDISKFEERWQWIKQDILPKWKQFETNPQNEPTLMQSLLKACPTISNE